MHVLIPLPLHRSPRAAIARAAWRRLARTWSARLYGSAMRALDALAAAVLLCALAPLLAWRALVAWRVAGRVAVREERVGQGRARIVVRRFAGPQAGAGLLVLWNVLRGDLAFVGPRALSAAEAEELGPEWSERFAARPGLISLHSVRRRTGIAHASEHASDRELALVQSLRHDLGLMARALPATILGGTGEAPPPELEILGVRMTNTTLQEATEWIVASAAAEEPRLLAFVNPDCLNIAHGSDAYRQVLGRAARVLPDGIGIHVAGRILGTPLRENVNGTDLFPLLCARLAETGLPLYLLGAREGVAAETAARMQSRFPGLRIAGARSGYFTPEQEVDVLAEINRSGARVLMVAMGVPRQELWLDRHHDRLQVPVRIGVGGLFDFYSGRIPRAPSWLRELGLEWTYRLRQEPARMWRRYVVGNPLFLWRVVRQARNR